MSALVVNTNISSLVAQNALNQNQLALSTATQRLSTGLRINSAADDAAGLAVSQLMGAQVMGLDQAVQNANDGVSMLQTADGAISTQQSIVQRMETLAVEASSSTLSDTDRSYINNELQTLLQTNNNIASSTQYNGQSVLTGSLSTTLGGVTGTNMQVGDLIGAHASVQSVDVSGATAGTTYTLTSGGAGSITLTNGTTNVSQTLTIGATAANGTQSLNFSNLGVNITLAGDATGETAAAAITALTASPNNTVVTAAGSGAAVIQIGANSGAGNSINVSFSNTKIDTLANGASAAMDALNTALSTFNTTSNVTNATALLSAVNGAIGYLNGVRSNLGADMNSLTDTVSNLQTTSTNLASAKSQITDADFAAETANLTRATILQQAGTAMLSQANSQPNQVLSLLQKLP